MCQDALPSLTELKLSSNEITQIQGMSKIHESTLYLYAVTFA
jgi:hypothetical protein